MKSYGKLFTFIAVCAFAAVLTFYGGAWAGGCGNGSINDGEECEVGIPCAEPGDTCDELTCLCSPPEPFCGDGEINREGEECEVGVPCVNAEDTCDESTCLCTPPKPVCGDGEINQEWEQCEVGVPCAEEGYTCDELACLCTPPPGGEGCTPGYWKQEQHFDSWIPTGYGQDDRFSAIFGIDPPITIKWSEKGKPQPLYNPTLLEALEANGGGINELARHGAAALLSAAHPDVAYSYIVGDVIAAVQAGDAETLVEANELGCPLNGELSDDNDLDQLRGVAACGTTVSGPGNPKAINLGCLVMVLGAVVLWRRSGRRS